MTSNIMVSPGLIHEPLQTLNVRNDHIVTMPSTHIHSPQINRNNCGENKLIEITAVKISWGEMAQHLQAPAIDLSIVLADDMRVKIVG